MLCCGVGATEVFKLSDFGIARPEGLELTFGASVLGTPGYMPPEQLGVGEVGRASDVFALAATTFRALSGEDYFTARNPVEALTQAQAQSRRSLRDVPTLAADLAKSDMFAPMVEPVDHTPGARVLGLLGRSS